MAMPVVEKPFDGDDHNVHIYYGKGKGSRRLFRKVSAFLRPPLPCETQRRPTVAGSNS